MRGLFHSLLSVAIFHLAWACSCQASAASDTASEEIRKGAQAYDRGDLQAAETHFTEAIRIDPKAAEAYFGRGLLYAHQKKFTQAIDDFNRALKLQPQGVDGYIARGLAYAHTKQFDKAHQRLHARHRPRFGCQRSVPVSRLRTLRSQAVR
jgi:tetratricopeptide (TPR) repeat protein